MSEVTRKKVTGVTSPLLASPAQKWGFLPRWERAKCPAESFRHTNGPIRRSARNFRGDFQLVALLCLLTSYAGLARRTGSSPVSAGTRGVGRRPRWELAERSLLRMCRSSRRSESRSSLPALHSLSLSCSFGTWGILARFDRRKCPFIKHAPYQSWNA